MRPRAYAALSCSGLLAARHAPTMYPPHRVGKLALASSVRTIPYVTLMRRTRRCRLGAFARHRRRPLHWLWLRAQNCRSSPAGRASCAVSCLVACGKPKTTASQWTSSRGRRLLRAFELSKSKRCTIMIPSSKCRANSETTGAIDAIDVLLIQAVAVCTSRDLDIQSWDTIFRLSWLWHVLPYLAGRVVPRLSGCHQATAFALVASPVPAVSSFAAPMLV